jgi:hypothetical protein
VPESLCRRCCNLADRAGQSRPNCAKHLHWQTRVFAHIERKRVFGQLATAGARVRRLAQGGATSQATSILEQRRALEERAPGLAVCLLGSRAPMGAVEASLGARDHHTRTAEVGSVAAKAAGLRLLRLETLSRQTFRAHRTTGEKPSVASVAPRADAPKGKMTLPPRLVVCMARSGPRGLEDAVRMLKLRLRVTA